MRLATISVDLDEIDCYAAIHGLDPPSGDAAHAIYRRALPRHEALFADEGVRATFFAIGRDLDDATAAAAIARLGSAGHEIGNHSYGHLYDLTRRDRRTIRDEIERGAEAEGLGDAYDLLSTEAERIPPGAEGLVFLPCMQGAMAPEWNGAARGVFYGLTLVLIRWVILTRRRQPASTVAWIVAIVLVPYVGGLLFLLRWCACCRWWCSRRLLSRRRLLRRRRLRGLLCGRLLRCAGLLPRARRHTDASTHHDCERHNGKSACDERSSGFDVITISHTLRLPD